MARLINANAAKIQFAKYREDCINGDDINAENVFDDVVAELDEFPTIDPVTAAAEALGMSPGRLRELAQAEKEGRLVVLPCLHGKKLLRDGLEFEPDHWNITLTAFAHNQPTRSGKRVGLFSICEAAEAALNDLEAEYDTGRTTIGNSRLLG